MIAEAVIKALIDAAAAEGFNTVKVLNAAGTGYVDANVVPEFQPDVAAFPDIVPTSSYGLAVSCSASMGTPFLAYGGEAVTRTSDIVVQVVSNTEGGAPAMRAYATKLATWLETGASAVARALAAHWTGIGNDADDAPMLMSLTVQDATDDPDETYDRTVITAEAVYSPSPQT